MSEPTRFRSKIAIMTATDWLNFGAALEKTWPEARYVLDPGQTRSWLTPRLLVSHSFARIYRPAEMRDNPISMVLDPAWRPEFYRRDDGRSWGYWPPRHPKVWFRGFFGVHRYPYPGCPLCLLISHLDVYCNPAFPEHFRFAGRFFRLLGRFASNRNLEEVHYPGFQPVESETGKPLDRLGPWRMVGHDARRWALESPDHFLEFSPQKMTGLRPVAEIVP